jgi:hypothetical protein
VIAVSADKENTFRTLRGEHLLVSSLWCSVGLHSWTRWRVHSRSDRAVYNLDGNYYRNHVFEKNCTHCDKIVRNSKSLPEEKVRV